MTATGERTQEVGTVPQYLVIARLGFNLWALWPWTCASSKSISNLNSNGHFRPSVGMGKFQFKRRLTLPLDGEYGSKETCVNPRSVRRTVATRQRSARRGRLLWEPFEFLIQNLNRFVGRPAGGSAVKSSETPAAPAGRAARPHCCENAYA